MKVTIHQPYYLPYLGFFHKIIKSDAFVLLDNAQFEKGNFYNRNKINSNSGEVLLTVPVTLESFQTTINDVKITSFKWQKKHYKTILQSYQKAPFFSDHRVFLEECFLENKWEKLADLNIFMIKYFLSYLDISIPVYKVSEMDIVSEKTERLNDICKSLNATSYLSGPSGKKYLVESIFQKSNIEIEYQSFNHPIYKSIHKEFLPNMSILDLLMNEGKDSKTIIMNTDNE